MSSYEGDQESESAVVDAETATMAPVAARLADVSRTLPRGLDKDATTAEVLDTLLAAADAARADRLLDLAVARTRGLQVRALSALRARRLDSTTFATGATPPEREPDPASRSRMSGIVHSTTMMASAAMPNGITRRGKSVRMMSASSHQLNSGGNTRLAMAVAPRVINAIQRMPGMALASGEPVDCRNFGAWAALNCASFRPQPSL